MTPEQIADLAHLRRARGLIDRDYAGPGLRRFVTIVMCVAVATTIFAGVMTGTALASSATKGGSATPNDPTLTPVNVAGQLFSPLDPTSHQGGTCVGNDYSICQLTAPFKAALVRYRGDDPLGPFDDSFPMCRCESGVATAITYRGGVKLPRALKGKTHVAVVEVQLDYGTKYSVFVLLHQESDGSWLAADTYCAAHKGDANPYANRLTANPKPCDGATTSPVAVVQSLFSLSSHITTPVKPQCGYQTNEPGTVFPGTNFSDCAVTPKLAAALHADSIGADALCRCQQAPEYAYIADAPLPAPYQGKHGFKAVDVRVNYEGSQVAFSEVVSVLLQKQSRGSWLITDTYCARSFGDKNPYANRMTAPGHQGCANYTQAQASALYCQDPRPHDRISCDN